MAPDAHAALQQADVEYAAAVLALSETVHQRPEGGPTPSPVLSNLLKKYIFSVTPDLRLTSGSILIHMRH